MSTIERYYGAALAFATTVGISRILLPAEVGVYSVAISVVGIATALREFGATNYLIRSANVEQKHLECAFGISLVLGWSLGFMLLGTAKPISRFFGQEEVAYLLWILAANLFLLPLGTTNYAMIQRAMRFDLIARIGIVATTLSSVVSLSLAYFGFGPSSLAWGAVALSSTSAVLTVLWGPGPSFVRPRLRGTAELLQFGSKSTVLTLIWEFSARLPEFFIGKLIGMTASGLYSRASGLNGNVNDLLLKGLQPVTLPYFSRVHREGGDVLQAHYRLAAIVTSVGWPAFAILGVIADPLTVGLFGERWADVVPLVRVLSLQMAYSLLFSYQLQIVMVKDAMGKQLMASLIAMPLRVILLLSGALLGLFEVCLALLLSQVAGTLIASRIVFPRIGASLSGYVKVGLRATPSTLVTFLFSLTGLEISKVFELGNLLTCCLALATGGLAFLATVAMGEHPLRRALEGPVRGLYAKLLGR